MLANIDDWISSLQSIGGDNVTSSGVNKHSSVVSDNHQPPPHLTNPSIQPLETKKLQEVIVEDVDKDSDVEEDGEFCLDSSENKDSDENEQEILEEIEDESSSSDSEKSWQPGNRKGAKELWQSANRAPIIPTLESIYQKCNTTCYLTGSCAEGISGEHIIKLRKEFLGINQKDAPKDRERAQRILKFLKKSRKDEKDNLIFKVGNKDVCTATFLRFLGVSSSVNLRDAPGQWLRLIKAHVAGDDDSEDGGSLIKDKDLKLDANEGYSSKEAHVIAFINEYCLFFSDAIPLAISEDDNGNLIETMVAPFETITDFFSEYNFCCDTANPPISEGDRAKYGVFKNAWNKLHDAKAVKFMSGKSGFPVCPTCCSIKSIKKTACCKRDTITRDVLKKLARLHLKQQATERQHAENFINLCKKMREGQPDMAYIDIDPQSVWTGNTPKYQKLNVKQNAVIENRNIGVHIVCGPIDEYISVCTNNLIPGGANVLIATTKFAIEYLSRRLSEFTLVLPKKIGLQYDNSGENKVSFNNNLIL